jgi:hypothetical protein
MKFEHRPGLNLVYFIAAQTWHPALIGSINLRIIGLNRSINSQKFQLNPDLLSAT